MCHHLGTEHVTFGTDAGEFLLVFRISWKSLDRRQLTDTPFHRTADIHSLRKVPSLYNARREQVVCRSFKTYFCISDENWRRDYQVTSRGRRHGSPLFAQNHAQQRTVYLKITVVVDES